MKTIILMMLGLAFISPDLTAQKADKQHVLIVTGEKKFDRESFFAMFNSFKNISWSELQHPSVIDLLGTDELPDFDAIVFYDMPARIELTEEQKERISLFFSSGVPVVFLHHALLSYQSWDEFRLILGGRYFENETLFNGTLVRSGYRHDVEYSVKVVDPEHPVTRGMSDFVITDEVYNQYITNPGITPLLTTDHPESGSIIGWVNRYGQSTVVYLINGHDHDLTFSCGCLFLLVSAGQNHNSQYKHNN